MITNADYVLVWLEDLGEALPWMPLSERKAVCDALARLLLATSLVEEEAIPPIEVPEETTP